MKLLIVCPRMPRIDGKADSMTVHRLVTHLARRHDVAVVTFSEGVQDEESATRLRSAGVDVSVVALNRAESLWRMARHAFDNVPLQTAYYESAAMHRLVRSVARRFRPDIVYAHLIRMAPYARAVPGVPRVLAMQISQTLNYSRMVSHVRSPFYRILYGIELRKVRRYESTIMREFDSCLLISKHDLQAIEGAPAPGKVFFSPHGVDAEYFRRDETVPREPATILFCGVLETPTNSDAVAHYVRHVHPRVRQQVPDARLLIVGRNPPADVRRLPETDSTITVVPSVPDVRPFYDRAAVGIAPIRIGAGLQNKLLIGMSMQQAMVVTPVANEGIGATSGEHLLVAEDPDDFAAGVVSLATDSGRSSAIGRRAREFIDRGWSWEYWFDQLEEHMVGLVRQAHGTPSEA